MKGGGENCGPAGTPWTGAGIAVGARADVGVDAGVGVGLIAGTSISEADVTLVPGAGAIAAVGEEALDVAARAPDAGNAARTGAELAAAATAGPAATAGSEKTAAPMMAFIETRPIAAIHIPGVRA